MGRVLANARSPIILFYYNPILNRGRAFLQHQLARVGVAGLVVPDLPLEEAEALLRPADEYGIDLTLLVLQSLLNEFQRSLVSLRDSLGECHWRDWDALSWKSECKIYCNSCEE